MEIVRTALGDTRLAAWKPDFYPPFVKGVELLDNAGNLEELCCAEEALNDGLDRLSRFIDSNTTAIFGKWVGLFWMAVEVAEGDTSLVGKGVEKMISQFYSAGSEDLGALTGSAPPELDEQTFSFCIGDRKPCFLGNNKRFRLLGALVQWPNKYIAFSDLAEQLGGDAWDVDALPALKCRLCRVLSFSGYADLAKSIKAESGHYGLFLR